MVVIDQVESVEMLLNDMQTFFKDFEEINKKLVTELSNKEAERDDLLHEIELSDLNIGERVSTYKKLKTVMQERRIIKDKIDLLKTIKPFEDEYVRKGICGEIVKTMKNIKTLKSNQETRQYTPRILKDLKCAKKKGE